jgi:DNA (cytosine-5)-methyltransferase 1
MLVGAQQAGFEIVGNIEWRTYYHTGTFEKNFTKGFMVKKMMDAIGLIPDEIELAMGHPECGKYSQLNPYRKDMVNDPGDIPLFINMVKELKPRYFVMDDLPMSFIAFPMEKYAEALPEYDLFPEWISNWGYGNVQKGRKRMFMIGSLKSEKFTFRPMEKDPGLKVSDILSDLFNQFPKGMLNHQPHSLTTYAAKGSSIRKHGEKHTWKEVRDHLSTKHPGYTFKYMGSDGVEKCRPSTVKTHWDKPSHVIHGGDPIIHALTNLPLSIRERARIQGFPDDFEFVGQVVEPDGTWVHEKNSKMVKQTGKAMPIQFCNYAATEVMRGLTKKPPLGPPLRILPSNEYVTAAKQWYCKEIGYSCQAAACSQCWVGDACSVKSIAMARVPLELPVGLTQKEVASKPTRKIAKSETLVLVGTPAKEKTPRAKSPKTT